MSEQYRVERDALGEVRVPADAYYGAETVRAAENFRISGRAPRPELIRAIAWVKIAAARANAALGVLDPEIAEDWLSAACEWCIETTAGYRKSRTGAAGRRGSRGGLRSAGHPP